MPSISALRTQIEAAFPHRISSALTSAMSITPPLAATCIRTLDEILDGGLPLAAITEVIGTECSGRTSLALSFIAHRTQAAKVCAWVDVSDALHPESASAAGVDLTRLLWVRCGVSSVNRGPQSPENGFALGDKYFVPPAITKGLHGGGFGPHPRGEVKGLANAVSGLLREGVMPPSHNAGTEHESFAPGSLQKLQSIRTESNRTESIRRPGTSSKPWSRIEQALRATDLLLQAGGFSAIVLDMGSIAPEHASRVPMATWFRYRAAAERTQASILLLTQYTCAKSSAGLALHLRSGGALEDGPTVFTGIEHRVEITRQRFTPTLRKQPQRETAASWQGRTTWTGP